MRTGFPGASLTAVRKTHFSSGAIPVMLILSKSGVLNPPNRKYYRRHKFRRDRQRAVHSISYMRNLPLPPLSSRPQAPIPVAVLPHSFTMLVPVVDP